MRHVVAVIGFLLATLTPAVADASSYIFSSVSELPNVVDGKPAASAIDTRFVFTYTPSVLGGGLQSVEVKVYLFNGQGQTLAVSKTGGYICAPCVINLDDSTNRRGVLNLEAQILQAGGFAAPWFDGYAVVTISNDDSNVGSAMSTATYVYGTPTSGLLVKPDPIDAPVP